jgi:hypothetical protein
MFLGFSAHSQQTDHWVNDAQTYFKILSATDGIVRIPVASLTQAGVPVSAFAPQNVQIFHRGTEIPVYIKGESQGSIEYIEFVGQKNNGWLDTGLFVTPLDQSNPYYSLVTDTSAYFLTWNSSFSNLRYQTINYSGTAQTPQVEFARRRVVYHQPGKFYSDETGPEFGQSEGWFSLPEITLGSSTTRVLTLEGKAPSGVVRCTATVVGLNDMPTQTGANHHLQIRQGTTVLLDTLFRGFRRIRSSFELNAASLTTTLTLDFRSINDQGVTSDRMTVAVLEADYPALFSMTPTSQSAFRIEPSGVTRRIVFQGLTAEQQPLVYEPTKGWRLITSYSTAGWSVTLPPSETDVELRVAVSPASIPSAQVKQAPMQITTTSADFIVVSHTKLMTSAQQYATYRGGFAVDVERLYNRFAYGINRHPLAIRYFLRAYIARGNPRPTYLFLIGKGINMAELRNSTTLGSQNLVPVPGAPPSDMIITSRLTQNNGIPEVMVGRLSAKSNEEVINYLDKVKEHVLRQPSLGAKNVLHFGGGNNASEQTTFANYLRNYETIITDTLFGGYVNTFLKNSSAPIVTTQSDSIRGIIENGPLLMTFFGHSWAGGFDQNIDEPETFNNRGKYSLIIANSCYSGNIFRSGSNTTSEKWVLIPRQGALVFLASTHLGYPSFLNRYTQEFYKHIAWQSYGQSYGRTILQLVNHLMTTQSSPYTRSTCLEFLFHGDPAVTPVTWSLPDPMIESSSLKLVPHNVTTALDSFALQIVVSNVGKTLSQPLQVYVERLLPNGSTQTKIVALDRLFYRDTLRVYFPVNRLNGVGQNRIQVALDYLGQIEELSETNNQQSISFIVSSTDIFPIYPANFAMQKQASFVLKASTGNPFEESQSYVFQLDTEPDFQSANLVSSTIQSGGGVVEWQPQQNLLLSQPYFWRVARENSGQGQAEWQTSSFTLSDNKTGWAQAGRKQFSDNEMRFISYTSDDNMEYISTPRELTCTNIGSATDGLVNYINYDIDGNGDYGSCGAQASIVVAVLDSLTLLPWKSDRANYGHHDYPFCSPRTRPNSYFTFLANETGRNNMSNFLQNVVRHGDYVLAYSVGNAQFETWTNVHYQAFEIMGASQIRTIPNNYPYIFIGKKGFPGFAEEAVGQTATSTITLEKVLVSNFYYGSMTTPWIGPAAEWKTLHWSPIMQALQPSDSVSMRIYTQTSSSADSLVAILAIEDTLANLSFLNLLGSRFIKLEYFTYDITQKTPTPPKSFVVEYISFPELAINPNAGFHFHANELMEGDSLVFGVAVTNVTDLKSGQFSVKYTSSSVDAKSRVEKIVTVDSLLPFQSRVDTLRFGTRGRSGLNQIQMEVNYPEYKAQSFPEPFTFNNVGWKAFRVLPDNRQPILTVLFDGRHIMNNEIVSTRPEILIRLNDQNPFIPLNDTAIFQIWLTTPESETAKRVWITPEMATGRLQWFPPSGSLNECRLVWNPVFELDGVYELQIKAQDITGNEAGTEGYRIRFEIVNRSSITRLLNYPNPFTTSTRFAFTITGHRLPDELRIQIFTVTGRVVREIQMSELGSLRIGQNLTEFAWDGTDQFGDRLANGVYFYRVISKIDGQNIENRPSGADRFFTKEFGKMYLMK